MLHVFSGSVVWCTHIQNSYVLLVNWSFYHYVMPFFTSNNFLFLKSTFSDTNIDTPTFLDNIYTLYLVPSFCFHPTYVIEFEGSFLWTAYSLVIPFILSASICILISICIWFTFKVIIEILALISLISLIILC